MNPNIRYQQAYVSSNSYKHIPNRTQQNIQLSVNCRKLNSDNQTLTQFRKFSQQVVYDNNHDKNSRQKSVNKQDSKPYIGDRSDLLPISYKLEASNLTGNLTNQQSSHYRTMHNFYISTELQKTESANDFFNQVASQISQQQSKMQKVISHTFNQPSQSQPPNQPTYSQQEIRKTQTTNQSSSQNNCDRCVQLQCQLQKVFKFMREQLQIGAKQYSDKMNKIVTQQAREIIDLRKLLINNEKGITKIDKLSFTRYQNERKLSPSQSQLKSKSPSKLSLTKSNTSISPYHSHRQKITMVSKQLSPNKSSNLNKQKLSQTQLSSNATTIEELNQKVRILQQKLQISLKIQNQTNQKIYLMNKRIEVLQRGIVNMFGTKVERVRENLRLWLTRQQQRQHNLYKQMKLMSSRMGTLSSFQQQPLSPLLLNSQNTHSTPLIPHFQQSQSFQLTNHKVLIRLKKYSSQLQDLRQLLTNLQTKEFKYDNYQITSLSQQIQKIKQKLAHLQKIKHHISHKLVQTEHKIDQQIIQASKHSKLASSTSKNQLLLTSNNYNQAEKQLIYLSNPNMRRINSDKNNSSVQLTYFHNNKSNLQSFNQVGTKSMKVYQYPQGYEGSKLTKCTKFTSGNYSNLEPNSHSQSEYKGFLSGEVSQYSQYMGESSLNINSNTQKQQQQINSNMNGQQEEQFEQSFNEDSFDQQNDEQSQQEGQQQQDEFFYPVDLGSGERQEVNGLRVSASNRRMGSNNNIITNSNGNNENINEQQQQQHQEYPTATVHRFMQVIQYRKKIPLKIEIDQTGYIKSAQNGMYIVDRNMDGFDLNKAQLLWLKERGIIIIEH